MDTKDNNYESVADDSGINADPDKKRSDGRRKLLRSLAAGGGVAALGAKTPDTWIQPVVDSVLLPVHAATSVVQSFAGAVATPFASNDNGGILDFFVSTAYAADCNGTPLAADGASVCIQQIPAGVSITFEGSSGAGTEAQLANAGIAVPVSGLVYLFTGSLTSGSISVSCPGAGNGGGKGSKGGGSTFNSTYMTVEGQACS